MGGGGQVKFYPYEKGGGRGTKSFSHAEGGGGGTQSFDVVLTQGLTVLAILIGGAKSFHLLKGGREKFYPIFGGGGCKKFGTSDFPILYSSPTCN